MSQALHCTPELGAPHRGQGVGAAGRWFSPPNRTTWSLRLLIWSAIRTKPWRVPRNIGFHVRHHFPMTPAQRPSSIGAFLVMHGQVTVKSVQMNLLLRNPSQRHDSRSQTVHRRRRVRRQTERSFEVGVRHVHQDGLSHVVEVVAQRNDVSAHPLRQVIDALATKHTAVGTRHSGRIFVLFNNRWKALHHLVHFEKRQFRIGDNVVLHAQTVAQRSGAFDRGGR